MIKTDKLSQALIREGSLIFASNIDFAIELEKKIPSLEILEQEGSTQFFENGSASLANTRIIVSSTGHIVFFNEEGRRFLCTDPEGNPLHEALWSKNENTGATELTLARMRLDNRQWVGIKPRAKQSQHK